MAQPYYPESSKRPLAYEELRDIIDLVLWAGQLLLQHGAESLRVEETIHRLGTALGCDWMDIFISANALVVTASSGGDFRTKMRRVPHLAVNMDIVAEVNDLSRRVAAGQLNREELGFELRRITNKHHNYNRWMIVGMVGMACAAFSRIFGGDWAVFIVTFFASSIAMFARQELAKRHFNTYLVVIVTAFIAGLIASAAAFFSLSNNPQIALAASVLLLVPGVPFLNSAEDIMKGHPMIGFTRGMTAGLMSLCIALGLILAIGLSGVSGILNPFHAELNIFEDALWSAIAALGFAMLFNIPPRLLPACVFVGAVGHALRALLVEQFTVPLEFATLAGALLVGFVSAVFARRLHAPSQLFAIPGVIPLIPGSFAYRAMIGLVMMSSMSQSETEMINQLLGASTNIIKTGLILSALAVGIAAPALIFERSKPVT